MPNEELEVFAQRLIAHVRDAAVRSCDSQLKPQANSPEAKKWRSLGATDAIRAAVPDIVDHTLFQLLHAIDEELLHLKMAIDHHADFDLAIDGQSELAGWYIGEWRHRFARERFFDENQEREVPNRDEESTVKPVK